VYLNQVPFFGEGREVRCNLDKLAFEHCADVVIPDLHYTNC